MKEIKKIRVLSMAKIFGLTSAIIGLVLGLLIGFIMFVVGSVIGTSNILSPIYGVSLGILGFVLIPLIHGIFGFLIGALTALLYNIFAQWIGGIEVEIAEKDVNETL